MTTLRALSAEEVAVLAGVITKLRPHGSKRWDAAGVRAAFAKVANLDAANVLMAAIRLSQDATAQTPGQIAITNSECWRERVSDWSPPMSREVCRTHEVALDALGTCRSCAADKLAPRHEPAPTTRSNTYGLDKDDIAAITGELRDHLAKAKTAD